MLFFSINFKFIPLNCFRRRKAFLKLYNEGNEKIEKMLDLLKIVKTNRKTKAIIKNTTK
jgi:hypothetical protein